MAATRTAILMVTAFGAIFSNADNPQRNGKMFMDIFNIVRLNPTTRLGVGVQITLPISTFMPDLGILGRHSRSHFSQNHGRFWPLKSPDSAVSTCPSRGVSVEDYLHLLHIDEESCQELFICELSADPNRFMPLSELLLKKLSFTNNMIGHFSNLINTTEYDLSQAARVGADANQDCQKTYWKCPVGVASMINMNLLKGWHILTRFLNIKFVGETEVNVFDH